VPAIIYIRQYITTKRLFVGRGETLPLSCPRRLP
jgi:hypothetical protein